MRAGFYFGKHRAAFAWLPGMIRAEKQAILKKASGHSRQAFFKDHKQ